MAWMLLRIAGAGVDDKRRHVHKHAAVLQQRLVLDRLAQRSKDGSERDAAFLDRLHGVTSEI